MALTRAEWRSIAARRLQNILRTHVVANERTLEQKISDAGPADQRAEPLILTEALRDLCARGVVSLRLIERTPWYYLSASPPGDIDRRLGELLPIYDATQDGAFITRLGHSLEIAVYKGLVQSRQQFLGHYANLENEESEWKKIDPPNTISGRTLAKGRLDFMFFADGGAAGIEVKNYRQWLYPDRNQVWELFRKCCEIDAVPVLIARRFPYITFQLLKNAGAVVHQVYNQLYFESDRELGEKAQNKGLLGYHDIRFGTEPDARLLKFLGKDLPNVLPSARERFDAMKDLHAEYGNQRIDYNNWVRKMLIRLGIWDETRPGVSGEGWEDGF
jgi:hypothetical protein